MENIEIRKATVADALAIAQLTEQAGGGFFSFLFGKKSQRVLSQMIESPNNLSSFQRTKVICVDGEVAGMVLGFSAKEHQQEKSHTDSLYGKFLGLRIFWVVFVITMMMPKSFGHPRKNEFYVNSIAVFPDFQRKGLAKQLIQSIEEEAHWSEMGSMTLDVDVDNPGAIHLYEKLGFKKVGTGNIQFLGYKLGAIHRMEKVLKTPSP